ncbi:MAG: amidohydrolase family protein [Phycisphaerae bacterium]
MIVDCYTHYWRSPSQVGLTGNLAGPPATAPFRHDDHDAPLDAGAERHFAACEPVDKTIVLGFESAYLNASVPNDQVAEYVQRHPDKLIGFAGIDPSNPKRAIEAMTYAKAELGMRGLSIAPAAQDVHPTASTAMKVYEAAADLDLPVLFHSGPYLASQSKMEYAKPILLDEVAREFPSLRMIIAHLGYPWQGETLVLLAKHANVFSDISWLLHQPWEAYQALLSASQYGVTDRLLFGSGFPYTSAANCIEGLYSLNQLVHGTNLPTLAREELRSIVERDALGLLGIGTGHADNNGQLRPEPQLLDDDN